MNYHDDGMTFGQLIFAIIAGIMIGVFAPAWVVFALFFGIQGNR